MVFFVIFSVCNENLSMFGSASSRSNISICLEVVMNLIYAFRKANEQKMLIYLVIHNSGVTFECEASLWLLLGWSRFSSTVGS